MPIQLIDNFELNVQKPIDNRFVVGGTSSFYPTRFDIVNAYNGLRIWDLNDNQGYVYNGLTWSSEASLTTIQGSGITNYLAKFSTSNSLNVSSIYENSGTILIGTTSLPSPSIFKMAVTGLVKADAYYGSGQNLTLLNASQISLGTLDLARLQLSGGSGYVLSRNASTATWINPTQFEVGTASALSTTRTLWGQNFNGTANVTGNISVLGSVVNVDALRFRNSNGGSLNMLWTNTTNLPFTLSIPASQNRTMALLEQTQIFTAQNTFSNFTLFNSSTQVTGTSSFGNEMKVRVTRILPFFGSFIPVTTEPLNVMFGGIAIGATSSNSSPLVTINGSYTWYGDDDTAMQRLSPSAGSTQGCILFKANNRTQMVLGQGVTPGYVHNSTAGETYSTADIALLSTPGVSMMGIISNWAITFGGAAINQTRWLNTLQDGLFTALNVLGTPFNWGGYKFDTTLSISCGQNAIVICYLELVLGSGVFDEVARIDFGGAFNFIIPAGRKWRVSLTSASTISTGNFSFSTFTLYKYGMN